MASAHDIFFTWALDCLDVRRGELNNQPERAFLRRVSRLVHVVGTPLQTKDLAVYMYLGKRSETRYQ